MKNKNGFRASLENDVAMSSNIQGYPCKSRASLANVGLTEEDVFKVKVYETNWWNWMLGQLSILMASRIFAWMTFKFVTPEGDINP